MYVSEIQATFKNRTETIQNQMLRLIRGTVTATRIFTGNPPIKKEIESLKYQHFLLIHYNLIRKKIWIINI